MKKIMTKLSIFTMIFLLVFGSINKNVFADDNTKVPYYPPKTMDDLRIYPTPDEQARGMIIEAVGSSNEKFLPNVYGYNNYKDPVIADKTPPTTSESDKVLQKLLDDLEKLPGDMIIKPKSTISKQEQDLKDQQIAFQQKQIDYVLGQLNQSTKEDPIPQEVLDKQAEELKRKMSDAPLLKREFLTFQTASGKTLYLIIDRDDLGMSSVKLVSEVTESDLLNMIVNPSNQADVEAHNWNKYNKQKDEQQQEIEAKEKAERDEKERIEREEKEKLEEEERLKLEKENSKKGDSNFWFYIIFAIVIIASVPILYYFKIHKNKPTGKGSGKTKKESDEDEDDEDEDDSETFIED